MRILKSVIYLLLVTIFLGSLSACTKQKDFTGIKEGDIIFQESTSKQSKAIQLATHSRYSHMGIIFMKDGELQVLEAVQPVKYTPLGDWISRGKGDHYVIKRLTNGDEALTGETISNMKKLGEKFIGRDYDKYFDWSDERIYCSELVWKLYNEVTGIQIGPLKKMEEFDLSNETVKNVMKQRYGSNIPLDETVISPGDIFDSDKLVTVANE